MSKLLWQPSEERIQNTNIHQFMRYVNARHGEDFANYEDLYRWSIDRCSDFWATLWDYSEVIYSRPYAQVRLLSSLASGLGLMLIVVILVGSS